MKQESNISTVTTSGEDIFNEYLRIKKDVTARIKTALNIMAQCNTLMVEPPKGAYSVAHDITNVASHQWQFNTGHETIYCQHMYDFHRGPYAKCTVKIPVKYLGMSEMEIIQENREAAIKALKEQRKALEDSIVKMSKPINDEIGEIDAKIKALKKEPDNENV